MWSSGPIRRTKTFHPAVEPMGPPLRAAHENGTIPRTSAARHFPSSGSARFVGTFTAARGHGGGACADYQEARSRPPTRAGSGAPRAPRGAWPRFPRRARGCAPRPGGRRPRDRRDRPRRNRTTAPTVVKTGSAIVSVWAAGSPVSFDRRAKRSVLIAVVAMGCVRRLTRQYYVRIVCPTEPPAPWTGGSGPCQNLVRSGNDPVLGFCRPSSHAPGLGMWAIL